MIFISAENHDFSILEKGKDMYKPNKDFAIEYDHLLKLFSLYVSFDPDYNYNKSYLLDKINEFSHEMSGYYRKQCIIEDAIQKWINEIPKENMIYINDIVIEFDDVFKFSIPFNSPKLHKLPSLQEVRSNYLKIKCHLKNNEISDYEKVQIKNSNDESVKDVVSILFKFLEKVIQNAEHNKGVENGK